MILNIHPTLPDIEKESPILLTRWDGNKRRLWQAETDRDGDAWRNLVDDLAPYHVLVFVHQSQRDCLYDCSTLFHFMERVRNYALATAIATAIAIPTVETPRGNAGVPLVFFFTPKSLCTIRQLVDLAYDYVPDQERERIQEAASKSSVLMINRLALVPELIEPYTAKIGKVVNEFLNK